MKYFFIKMYKNLFQLKKLKNVKKIFSFGYFYMKKRK